MECLAELETRTESIELKQLRNEEQTNSEEARIVEMQRKLKDFDNRQRRNNLCVLGKPEDVEGTDPQVFIVQLFKTAFPELAD